MELCRTYLLDMTQITVCGNLTTSQGPAIFSIQLYLLHFQRFVFDLSTESERIEQALNPHFVLCFGAWGRVPVGDTCWLRSGRMKLLLFQLGSTADELRFWVGVLDCVESPSLSWSFNGKDVEPQAVHTLQAVRPAGVLAGSKEARTFSGVCTFPAQLATRVLNIVSVRCGGEQAVLRAVRRLPRSIRGESAGLLRVFLTSCFHVDEADAEAMAATMDCVRKACSPQPGPDFSVLMGDQVYLDLPTIADFPSENPELARLLEEKYVVNWRGGAGGRNFDQVLRLAPFFAQSDDHEFWNNYPHVSPVIQNSWTQAGRQSWAMAAAALFRGFQAADPANPERPVRLDLEEVSFLFLDTRFARKEDTFLPPGGLDLVGHWVDDLNTERRIGVIVTGQSLYAPAAGMISGKVEDKEYPDYLDYRALVEQLIRVEAPLICLTGDVHWGRVLRSIDRRSGRRGNVYEVITSPSSLVSTVVKDQIRRGINSVASWFGGGNEWPRHSSAQIERAVLQRGFANGLVPDAGTEHGQIYETSTLFDLRGNMVSMLELRSAASGRLSAEVVYWNVVRNNRSRGTRVHLFEYSR